MTDYPHLRAFLIALLQLDEVEAQLPIQILVRLHRRQLRKPMVGLTKLIPDEVYRSGANWNLGVAVAVKYLQQRYPELEGGTYLQHSAELKEAYQIAGKRMDRFLTPEAETMLRRLEVGQEQIIRQSNGYWDLQEPFVCLHRLTWSNEHCDVLAPVMEAELGIDPTVARMLLELAKDADA